MDRMKSLTAPSNKAGNSRCARPRSPVFPLKDQLQVELQFPHVDAGYGAGDRAKASIGCARDGDAVRTELARVQSVIRIAEVRVVEEIEGLKPELQYLRSLMKKPFLPLKSMLKTGTPVTILRPAFPNVYWGWSAKA
jgi:hypothetical protein